MTQDNQQPKTEGNKKPHILFATITAGGAHVSTAQAMAQGVEAYYPGQFDLTISELMEDYGFVEYDTRHKESWRWALEQPWRARLGQQVIDHFPWATNQVLRSSLRAFAKEAAARLNEQAPTLVVPNHPFLAVALSTAQQDFGLKVPVLTFQTSILDSSALWAEPRVERMVVGGPRGKNKLVSMGVPAEKIDVIGYPIKQSILNAPDKATARAKLNLQDKFTCLIVLGGEGVGSNPKTLIDTLFALEKPLQVVVICGRNKALKEEIEAANLPNVVVEGFTEDMASYLAATDIIIGKTGPTASAEALVMGKPFLCPEPSGGAEVLFNKVLDERNLGGSAFTPEVLQKKVLHYYENPAALQEVYDKTRAIKFAKLTRNLIDYIVHYAKTGKPDTSLCGEGIVL